MEPEVLGITAGSGEPVANEFLAAESASGVVFFFPGRGYGIEEPPIHFLRQMLVERGYDFLSLRYWYQVQGVEWDPEADPAAEQAAYERALGEARAAVQAVLQRRGYDRVLIIGKSYGADILNDLAFEMPELADARLVYLTPVFPREGFPAKFRRLRQPALVVLGTRDRCYDARQLEELGRERDFRLTVLPNVHHGLEDPDDYRNSIRAIETICEATAELIAF